MFKIIQISEIFKRFNKLPFLIFIFCCSVNCQEKKSIDYQDYGTYNNVASIISAQNTLSNQTIDQFRPSKWINLERIRRLKRLEDIEKYRRYQEYKKRMKYNHENQINNNNNQFKRRSDIDDEDYYTPPFYTNNYGIVYPPAIQPIISLPAPLLTDATSPSAIYRKYRPSASRNYYHRIYPSSVLRRRLASASSPSSNYETSLSYANAYAPSAAHSSAYYYGAGLAPQPVPTYAHPTYTHTYAQHGGFPNTHGLAHHAADAHDVHERTEVHSLLPIITVIGIGAFLIPLFTTFFTAMISGGGSCCSNRQTALKERNGDPLDFRNQNLYEKTKDIWKQVEKAMNTTY